MVDIVQVVSIAVAGSFAHFNATFDLHRAQAAVGDVAQGDVAEVATRWLHDHVHRIVERERTDLGDTRSNVGHRLHSTSVDGVEQFQGGTVAGGSHIHQDAELIVRAVVGDGIGYFRQGAIQADHLPLPSVIISRRELAAALAEGINAHLHVQIARGGEHIDRRVERIIIAEGTTVGPQVRDVQFHVFEEQGARVVRAIVDPQAITVTGVDGAAQETQAQGARTGGTEQPMPFIIRLRA